MAIFLHDGSFICIKFASQQQSGLTIGLNVRNTLEAVSLAIVLQFCTCGECSLLKVNSLALKVFCAHSYVL